MSDGFCLSMGKKLNIVLKNDTGQVTFPVKTNQTGDDVVEMVCRTLNLREPWFLTLSYTLPTRKETFYLRKSSKLSAQPMGKQGGDVVCLICVYIYPEDVKTGIITQQTYEVFYATVKQLIKEGTLYASSDKCLLLASMATLCDYGMYNPQVNKGNYIDPDDYIPQIVFNSYDIPKSEWQNKLAVFHQQISDDYSKNEEQTSPTGQYLKYAQDLDMFGVYYTNMMNKNKTKLLLGLSPMGINVYQIDDSINPISSFPYGEIKSVTIKNKKLKLKLSDPKSGDSEFCLWLDNEQEASMVVDMILEYRTQYFRNRKEDTESIKMLRRQSCLEEEALRKQKAYLSSKCRQVIDLENKMRAMSLKMQNYGNYSDKDNEDYDLLREQVDLLRSQLEELMAEKFRLEEKLSQINVADEERNNMEAELAAKTSLLNEKEQRISELVEEFERTRMPVNNISDPEPTLEVVEPVMAAAPRRSTPERRGEDVLENLEMKISQLEEKFIEDRNNKRRLYDDIRKQRDELEKQLEELIRSQKEAEDQRESQMSVEAQCNAQVSDLTAKYDDYIPQINQLSDKLKNLIDEKEQLEILMQDLSNSSNVASNTRKMMEDDLEQKRSEAGRIQNQIHNLEEELRQAQELLQLTEREQENILRMEKEKTRKALQEAQLKSEIDRLTESMAEAQTEQIYSEPTASATMDYDQTEQVYAEPPAPATMDYVLTEQVYAEVPAPATMDYVPTEQVYADPSAPATMDYVQTEQVCAEPPPPVTVEYVQEEFPQNVVKGFVVSNRSSMDEACVTPNEPEIEINVDTVVTSPDDVVEIVFRDAEVPTMPSRNEERVPAKIAPRVEFQKFVELLDQSKRDGMESRNDVIYRSNVLSGRNKYKTLQKIRANNTKKHVEAFELL